MHERNPYKRPPDFAQYASVDSDFRAHCKLVANAKIQFDFGSDEGVRSLTRTLLKQDFQLDVDLPEGTLCPRVPQRLDYLLWIEDIVTSSGIDNDDVIGIDIGTGASCIYALLGVRRMHWSFLATDIDDQSISVARRTVARNGLEGSIDVIKVDEKGSVIEDVVNARKDTITFCMCNPPFFDGDVETEGRFDRSAASTDRWQNRATACPYASDDEATTSRAAPHSATVATVNELATEGGEIALISRLIDESTRLRQRVRFYTTMLGKKSSVVALRARLDTIAKDTVADSDSGDSGRIRYAFDEMKQGRTQRWLLVWTYCDDVILPSHSATLPLAVRNRGGLEKGREWLWERLAELGVTLERIEDDVVRQKCTATEPMWLRKARKRKFAQPFSAPLPPFIPLVFTVTEDKANEGYGSGQCSTVNDDVVHFLFTISDDRRKRELSQLVVHLANKLL